MNHTADAPHVRGLVVLIFNKHNLWGSIPSGTYMYRACPLLVRSSIIIILQNLSHFSLIPESLLLISVIFLNHFLYQRSYNLGIQLLFALEFSRYRSRQSEITYFDLAILGQQQVCRFDISVHYISFMKECHGTEGMI